jgi:hypothetical protein
MNLSLLKTVKKNNNFAEPTPKSPGALISFAFCVTLLLSVLSAAGSQAHNSSASLKTVVPRTSGKTDRRVYPEPPLPSLPRAGGKFRDPAFGTELMRVTDEADGASNGTFYSYWPTFNSNSTRLLARRANGDSLYEFNPNTFTLGARFEVPRTPDNATLVTEGAVWSATDPDTLYATAWNGPRLWAVNARTRTCSLVHDFGRADMASTDFLWQMSVSDDGDVFAFTHKNRNYKVVGYTVYRRSSNRVILEVKVPSLNEVRVDKTGRYLIVSPDGPGVHGWVCLIRDLQTGAVDGLVDGAPDYAPAHGDVGAGALLAWDNDDNRLLYRSLATPHVFRSVLNLASDWMNLHLSLLGENQEWAMVSFYSYKGAGGVGPGLFHNELVLVSTDGSQRIRRVAHHRSIAQDYWDTPRANLSRDGRFVAFSSNWGGRKRQDLFIARLDPPLSSSRLGTSRSRATEPRNMAFTRKN